MLLTIFQSYRNMEAGDNQSLKFKWHDRDSNPRPLVPQAESFTIRPLPLSYKDYVASYMNLTSRHRSNSVYVGLCGRYEMVYKNNCVKHTHRFVPFTEIKPRQQLLSINKTFYPQFKVYTVGFGSTCRLAQIMFCCQWIIVYTHI